ncbi:CLUMA_CG015650, isoform A [Clunio marinus]|uniref:CLUMA_CG015650, isoform A n=1 Tax=Clunio marinus TaxID=568069 RepID=A0A1J1IQ38_9DIPT|nr:CLUMA_CG015650, isoform A [Clunio marinus]
MKTPSRPNSVFQTRLYDSEFFLSFRDLSNNLLKKILGSPISNTLTQPIIRRSSVNSMKNPRKNYLKVQSIKHGLCSCSY